MRDRLLQTAAVVARQSAPQSRPDARPENVADIAVLLAVYEPDESLGAQLASIRAQTYEAVTLIVSDDSPNPSVVPLLPSGSQRLRGPQRGFAANFLNLLRAVPRHVQYAAFSDQDDVWMKDKLARAIDALGACDRDVPAIYGSRTWICDADLADKTPSRLPDRAPGFCNALVQNILHGNTMVLNRAAIDLVNRAGLPDGVISHDWWVYQLVTGAGGRVLFDPLPSLFYRQHGRNLVGANRGFRAVCKRVAHVWRGDYRRWMAVHWRALDRVSHLLTPGNVARLRLVQGRFGYFRGRVYRQGAVERLGFWIAFACGRL